MYCMETAGYTCTSSEIHHRELFPIFGLPYLALALTICHSEFSYEYDSIYGYLGIKVYFYHSSCIGSKEIVLSCFVTSEFCFSLPSSSERGIAPGKTKINWNL